MSPCCARLWTFGGHARPTQEGLPGQVHGHSFFVVKRWVKPTENMCIDFEVCRVYKVLLNSTFLTRAYWLWRTSIDWVMLICVCLSHALSNKLSLIRLKCITTNVKVNLDFNMLLSTKLQKATGNTSSLHVDIDFSKLLPSLVTVCSCICSLVGTL